MNRLPLTVLIVLIQDVVHGGRLPIDLELEAKTQEQFLTIEPDVYLHLQDSKLNKTPLIGFRQIKFY